MEGILQTPKKNHTTWGQLIVFAIRTLLGLFLGVVLSVVGQEVIGYGKVATVFVVLTCVGLTLRLTKNWSFAKVLVLVLNVFLFFVFLRIYILVAPGE